MNRYYQDYMLSENTWFSCPTSGISFRKIGCSEVPKLSYPHYFDQLSERSQPLCKSIVGSCKLVIMGIDFLALKMDSASKMLLSTIFVCNG